MEPIKLAVISDIHVGLDARSKDLCPEPPAIPRKNRDKYNRKIESAYRQKFVEFIQREHITADYLVIPGDITSTSQPPEVEIASEFILQAAEALEVPHNKIVFSPGNHDVNWLMHDLADTTGVKWGERYNMIGHDDFHFSRLVNQGEGDIFSPPHFTAWTFEDLLVVSYNSASHDTPISEDAAHHGLADPIHLDAISKYLEDKDSSDDHVRLFLVHHHPYNFADPIPDKADFSLMTNAEGLLTLLHENNFDLLVHGHKHHPRFETHTTLTYSHLPILCSGSFSTEIDSGCVGNIANQFHLVTVSGREGTESQIQGKIDSWANTHSRGWFPSVEFSCGIHHIIPFGNYVMPAELDSMLTPFIRSEERRVGKECRSRWSPYH